MEQHKLTENAFTRNRKLTFSTLMLLILRYEEKGDTIKKYKHYRILGFDGCKTTVPDYKSDTGCSGLYHFLFEKGGIDFPLTNSPVLIM